jgi:hypothetical protein
MEAQGFVALPSLARLLFNFDKLGPVQPMEGLEAAFRSWNPEMGQMYPIDDLPTRAARSICICLYMTMFIYEVADT